MRKVLVLTCMCLFCLSCEKDDFDTEHPDVKKFVDQIKTGTYSSYFKGEDGENLWLIMPNFKEEHIGSLLVFSKDTTHIKAFPFNPISSRTPYPHGRDYAILGECLLWTVEGIRNGSKFGSLDPYVIDKSKSEIERYKGLNGSGILSVRELYLNWWSAHSNTDWRSIDPLENTSYRWF